MGPKQLIRKGARDIAAGLLHYTGGRRVMAAMRRKLLGGRRLLIVSYHRVVDDFARELRRSIPGLLISSETFRGHLESIHAAGFEFSTLDHALAVLSGQRSAKKDLCVLTFDDGYRDVYRNGFPIRSADRNFEALRPRSVVPFDSDDDRARSLADLRHASARRSGSSRAGAAAKDDDFRLAGPVHRNLFFDGVEGSGGCAQTADGRWIGAGPGARRHPGLG